MVLQNNTICITGGSSGIGLELTKRLTEMGNKVLICGRNSQKLQRVKEEHPGVHSLACDLSKASECERLYKWIREEHPECNILINNAAITHAANFFKSGEILEKADAEIQINLMAPIRLAKLFYPLLAKNREPAIINITTGLVYIPRAIYPFYNATKAAVHSFTKVLREQARSMEAAVRVIEVQFPAVDTPWHNGNPPDIAISVEQAVDEMISGLKKDKEVVKVGKVKLLYYLSRIAPDFAFKKLNALTGSPS